MTLQQIKEFTENYFKIDDLSIKSRKKEIVFARDLAFFISEKCENVSLSEIGSEIACRDHATVIQARKKVKKYLAEKTLKGNFLYEKEVKIINEFLLEFNKTCDKQTEFDVTEIQFYKAMNKLRNENLVEQNQELQEFFNEILKNYYYGK